MFLDMAAKYGISVHGRKVRESSLSFIMPNDGKRAIVRCRDTDFLHPFQELTLTNCRALHLDGHMPDAAIHYAKACRDVGILTSLDGGAVRENTEDLLAFIDVAVVSERFCQQLDLSVTDTLEYLRSKGCRVAGVTLGDAGLYWCEGAAPISHMPALDVPGRLVLDTNGAGDVFHGAYLYAYLSASEENWKAHFSFARAASAHAIQNLGNEASLPTLQNVRAALDTWQPKTGHPQT